MLVSSIKEEDLSAELVDRLLFQGLEDTGENVDCILVLGSMKAAKYRVPVAVQAIKAGRARKIILCGGKIRSFSDGQCSEAEHMYKAAVKMGVNESDILLENSSQNTVENIQYALIELQQTLGLNKLHKILLVTTAYHMRRSLAIARNLFPEHIEVLPCPANDNNTRRENWMNTEVGFKRTMAEAMKLIMYVDNGIIPDFEVDA